MGALLCLIADLFVFVHSLQQNSLILLTTNRWHICIGVTRFSLRVLPDKQKGWSEFWNCTDLRVAWGPTENEVCGEGMGESQTPFFFLFFFPTAVSATAAFCSRWTARWTAQEVGMWPVAAGCVALPRIKNCPSRVIYWQHWDLFLARCFSQPSLRCLSISYQCRQSTDPGCISVCYCNYIVIDPRVCCAVPMQ